LSNERFNHQLNPPVLFASGNPAATQTTPQIHRFQVAYRHEFLHVSPMSFPIRSPRHQVHGIDIFARVVDKIRLHAAGNLPEGYHIGVIPGSRTFDERLCRFLGVSFEDLSARVLQGGTDEELMAWCFAHGRKPDEEQIEVWNGFMSKRGWRDSASENLHHQKTAAGLAAWAEIMTFFDLIDVEEGRA
jgi:gluconokinase